jgi:hypothetical protein
LEIIYKRKFKELCSETSWKKTAIKGNLIKALSGEIAIRNLKWVKIGDVFLLQRDFTLYEK